MLRQTGKDIRTLVTLVQPHGKTISSLLALSAQGPDGSATASVSQAQQLWQNCANGVFLVEPAPVAPPDDIDLADICAVEKSDDDLDVRPPTSPCSCIRCRDLYSMADIFILIL